MEIPKDCRSCPYTNDCKSWYGGSACRYRKAMEDKRRNEDD